MNDAAPQRSDGRHRKLQRISKPCLGEMRRAHERRAAPVVQRVHKQSHPPIDTVNLQYAPTPGGINQGSQHGTSPVSDPSNGPIEGPKAGPAVPQPAPPPLEPSFPVPMPPPLNGPTPVVSTAPPPTKPKGAIEQAVDAGSAEFGRIEGVIERGMRHDARAAANALLDHPVAAVAAIAVAAVTAPIGIAAVGLSAAVLVAGTIENVVEAAGRSLLDSAKAVLNDEEPPESPAD